MNVIGLHEGWKDKMCISSRNDFDPPSVLRGWFCIPMPQTFILIQFAFHSTILSFVSFFCDPNLHVSIWRPDCRFNFIIYRTYYSMWWYIKSVRPFCTGSESLNRARSSHCVPSTTLFLLQYHSMYILTHIYVYIHINIYVIARLNSLALLVCFNTFHFHSVVRERRIRTNEVYIHMC